MEDKYLQSANEELGFDGEDELDIDEYIDKCQNNDTVGTHSIRYILEAIDHYGTRTVYEEGEEKERYVFFDDPYGGGEHAILGNTDTLNDLVDSLRRMASEEGENQQIIWFEGPTATGKSELKRCLVNGIEGFSRTEQGAKYTIEWSLDSLSEPSRMSYGDGSDEMTKNWYKSPVNNHPLSVFPKEARGSVLSDINSERSVPVEVITDLDPFSREAFDVLSDRYSSFEDIVSSKHLRIKRYYPEVGDGIGVLHTEDTGDVKDRLVGGWMKGAMEEFADRGRKNAQAFSYDGVLSQGNRLVSIVEDASHHSDVLDKLMNVCEEKMIKLDNRIAMDIDTLLVIISNPDLTMQLEEYIDEGQADPLRALRRRMDKYKFGYLVTLSIEAMLIRRLLKDSTEIWDGAEDRMDKVIEPVEIYECELAPRTVEAAAMYEVVTRLKADAIEDDVVGTAMLLEEGEYENEVGERYQIDDYNEQLEGLSGSFGVPVTYTIDVIVDLAQENDVVMPEDVVKELSENLIDSPIFGAPEANQFENMSFDVEDYIFRQQESDVLEAMIGDINVSEEEVRDYIDSLLAWDEDNTDNFDRYEMREFEKRYLGQDGEDYDSNAEPSNNVKEFRRETIAPINKFLWDNRNSNFKVNDVPLSKSPVLQPLLEENDWETVNRVFPEADLKLWKNPPSDTQTEELKEKTVNRLMELYDYSEESAEQASTKVAEAKAYSEELNNGS